MAGGTRLPAAGAKGHFIEWCRRINARRKRRLGDRRRGTEVRRWGRWGEAPRPPAAARPPAVVTTRHRPRRRRTPGCRERRGSSSRSSDDPVCFRQSLSAARPPFFYRRSDRELLTDSSRGSGCQRNNLLLLKISEIATAMANLVTEIIPGNHCELPPMKPGSTHRPRESFCSSLGDCRGRVAVCVSWGHHGLRFSERLTRVIG